MENSNAPTPARDDATRTIERCPPAPIGAIVRVVRGKGAPTELRLDAGVCIIGAGGDADLVIDDTAVSRRHVELNLVPEGVIIRDLSSRNGTYYLGQRIEKMVLGLGSRFTIGSTEILLQADATSLSAPPEEDQDGYRELMGSSPPMRQLFAMLHRLEGSLVNVLVQGESGVGKELIARALHQGSSVADGPLVVVNCGAIGRELVLSELFGHKKGSFTGATDNRIGAFEAADGGTLFLDEIGELPIDMQPALLRALESGEIKPLGENDTRHVKVRVVAATNRDLTEEIADNNFREDLYYRLAIVKLAVPPLRARPEDIPSLAQHFAQQAGAATLPDEVVEQLQGHQFPGNARELKNAVLAYLAIGTLPEAPIAEAGLLELALKQSIDASQAYQTLKDEFVAVFSKAYFQLLMEKTGGNQSEAARISEIDRSYLGKLLSKYGVKKKP